MQIYNDLFVWKRSILWIICSNFNIAVNFGHTILNSLKRTQYNTTYLNMSP